MSLTFLNNLDDAKASFILFREYIFSHLGPLCV
jgi:hypothetical protein